VTGQYLLFVAAQGAVATAGALAARWWFGASLATALSAALLFNAVPLPIIPGLKTSLFVHDLAVPCIALRWLVSGKRSRDPLLWLAATAALIWPVIGTTLNWIHVDSITEGLEFLYRRLGFVVLFGAGVAGVYGRVNLRSFLNTCVAIWLGMCVMGYAQYAGLVDTDIWASVEDEFRQMSIAESVAAARGFMGLNRGAVGVWGSAVCAYCVGSLAFVERLTGRYYVLYYAGAMGSASVVFLSGSRTGVIAVIGAAALVAVRTVAFRPRALIARFGVLGIVAVAVAAVAMARVDLTKIAARYAFESSTLETGEYRAGVQRDAIAFILDHPRALLVGMGQSTEQFVTLVGDPHHLAHTHSEYIEVMWQAGLPGLSLYLGFLWLLYRRLGIRRSADGLSVQAMLVAGLVCGLAVGNVFISSARLASFGLLTACVYGSAASRVWARIVAEDPIGAAPCPLSRGPRIVE
jgi:hypothetical protein